MNQDNHYMKIAIDLARKGCGQVNPNPMVGAVVVKDGQIIGMGFHEKFGGFHAERNALAACKESPEGATLYVNLEPCCHHGKTPPCTEAIIEHKIHRVVIGADDPNPLVGGKGIARLESCGIQVTSGVLADECKTLNQVFYQYIRGKPFVALKYAMSLDGKIAASSGESKWITGEQAREHVHHLRHQYSAILVGIGTVMADNPMLNCRIEHGKNPVRIICDTNLVIQLESNIVKTAKEIPTFIACSGGDQQKRQALAERGCRIWDVSKSKNGIDLEELVAAAHHENIDSILIEGGSQIHFSALESGIVNKVYAYIAPKLIGGIRAKTPVGGEGFALPDAVKLNNRKISYLGEDILIEYERT